MSDFSGDIEFRKLLAARQDIDLVQLMLELAADVYPHLDRLGCLLEIDRLAVLCEQPMAPLVTAAQIRRQLTTISQVLYGIEGFHGNRDAYYDPDNSYLNCVLERRCGIPISLGILYMAVASRLGLRMFGVNTPGHFVIGCQTESENIYVDPFTAGDVLSRDECKQRIEESIGERGVVHSEHFRPAGHGDIAVRVLRNLKTAHAMANQWDHALTVQKRLTLLLPQFAQEQRDLGLIYLRAGQPTHALSLLEQYLSVCGNDQRAVLETSVRTARKMVAELN